MDSLLSSFLDAIKMEKDVLLELNELNLKLRSALVSRDNAGVSILSAELAKASLKVSDADKTREALWTQVREHFSLEGTSFYAQIGKLADEHKEDQIILTEAYQGLKIAYGELRNSTASLEIYTDTALDITETLLEGVRVHEDDTYSASGHKHMKESSETRALLINEEL